MIFDGLKRLPLLMFDGRMRTEFLRGEGYVLTSFFLSVWPRRWAEEYLSNSGRGDIGIIARDLATEKHPLPRGRALGILVDHVREFKKYYRGSLKRTSHDLRRDGDDRPTEGGFVPPPVLTPSPKILVRPEGEMDMSDMIDSVLAGVWSKGN